MRSYSFALARDEMQDRLQAATNEHRKAAMTLGVRLNGRPTKYRPELAVLAYSIFTDFRTIATTRYVAAMLGVSRSTLYAWMRTHDDLRMGIEWGKALQECWLATCLLHGHNNTRGVIFALSNLHGWRSNPTLRRTQDIAAAIKRQEQLRVS
jgi:hypothetical protein